MDETCVVHLIWGPLGSWPLTRFMSTYLAHPAGSRHRLLFLVNGATERDLRHEISSWAEQTAAQIVDLDQPMLDLAAYAAVADRVDDEVLCFLNSYSQIRGENWLDHLLAGLRQPGVGVAGASGSWGSMVDYTRFQLGLPSGYAGVFEGRERTRLAFLEMAREDDPDRPDRGRVISRLGTAGHLVRQNRHFDRFPAPHLRTNAFVLRRDLLLSLSRRQVRRKLDAYRMESGRSGLTAQITQRGLRTIVVGADGSVHESADWPDSETLWQGDQTNLLVADNRTDEYQRAGPARRRLLSQLAWGSRARPG